MHVQMHGFGYALFTYIFMLNLKRKFLNVLMEECDIDGM